MNIIKSMVVGASRIGIRFCRASLSKSRRIPDPKISCDAVRSYFEIEGQVTRRRSVCAADV